MIGGVVGVAEQERALPDAASFGADLQGMDPLVAGALLAFSILPLFFGWRLMRLSLAVAFGVGLFAGFAMEDGGGWGSPFRIGIGAGLGLLGMVGGWYLYHLNMALQGAIILGVLGVVPGVLAESWLLSAVLGGVGALVGAVVGWKAAPYIGVMTTALAGGLLAATGVAGLVKPDGGIMLWGVWGGSAAFFTVFGVGYQLKKMREADGGEGTGSTRKKEKKE